MLKKIYISLSIILLLIPSLGMIFWFSDESAEKRQMASFPKFIEHDQVNLEYLADLGAYFEDHFALRNLLVTINSSIYSSLFKTSSSDQVVIGKDGWLFFEGDLNDYQDLNSLNERELNNIVHNLSLYQFYVESRESQFLLAIAPNKCEIYPEFMPETFLRADEKNWTRLKIKLKEAGINFCDLEASLLKEKEKGSYLYYKNDSHWNYRGALAAYNALMNEMGIAHESYASAVPSAGTSYQESDLSIMLYPALNNTEPDQDYSQYTNYEFTSVDTDLMAELLETVSVDGDGTLLMYRDSYGQALIPFFSSAFEKCIYTRTVPYNFIEIENRDPDCVIIERTERRIASFQEQAALIRVPVVQNINSTVKETDTMIEIQDDMDFIKIKGTVDGIDLSETDQLYLRTVWTDGTEYTYPMFYTEGDGSGNGFELYLEKRALSTGTNTIEILLNSGQEVYSISQRQWQN